MRRLLTTSATIKAHSIWPGIHSPAFSFTKISSLSTRKAVEYQFSFRSIVKLEDLERYLSIQAEGIRKYGKTVLLEFLNEYPMQSFKRTRDEPDLQILNQKRKVRHDLYIYLTTLQNLNFYQQNLRYSIFKKFQLYDGNDQQASLAKHCALYEEELLQIIKNGDLHILDLMNWLFMLPIDHPPDFCLIAMARIDKFFQSKEVRQYMKAQRGIPMLIKRISQIDWSHLREYKNILYFFTYEASLRENEILQDLALSLQRMCAMRWHMIGERTIPKIVDDGFEYLNHRFEELSKNKLLLLKVFSCFNYMPINFNKSFFEKIHNYIKGMTQLPSHSLIMMPYKKLTQGEITYIQSKIFINGREDTASKLIYTIYKPYYKEALTPLIMKEGYLSMLTLFKHDNMKNSIHYQTYNALVFRFMKVAGSHSFMDLGKLKEIAMKMATVFEEMRYEPLQVFSFAGICSFVEICEYFDLKINFTNFNLKLDHIIPHRNCKNSFASIASQTIEALHVHSNTSNKKCIHILSLLVQQIILNRRSADIQYVIKTIFIIEKSNNPDSQWRMLSNKLYQKFITSVEGFVQTFTLYEYKNLRLTNFIFTKILQQKVKLHTVIDLVSCLNLKLIVSLKGKLLVPLKKYLSQLNFSDFDIEKNSIANATLAFKTLFYFRHQIPQFMEYFAIQIINKIWNKVDNDEVVHGKTLCASNIYLMETLANSDMKTKTEMIEIMVNIFKNLRKKEGLFMKVFELDFLCSHQKHIMINSDVLEHHFSQVIQTLKKTQRIEHNRDLFFIMIKLHCRQFVQLSPYDLRNFIDKTTELVSDNWLTLSNIKQILGYEILRCQEEFVIEKLKMYLGQIVKLAFRKEKLKHNYFVHEYFMRLFSKLGQREVVAEIVAKLLGEKLLPLEINSLVPMLSRNQIKNRVFVNRIVTLITLSDQFVTTESIYFVSLGMQVYAWIDKIMYELPNSEEMTQIKKRVGQDIRDLILKITRASEQSKQEYPFFDEYTKVILDFLWSTIKNKLINSKHFQFLTNYFYANFDKFKSRIQNPIQNKRLSKTKLAHVLKYFNLAGTFQLSPKQIDAVLDPLQEQQVVQRKKKNKIIAKLQSSLANSKIQKCFKLQQKLSQIQGITFQHEVTLSPYKSKNANVVQYMVTEAKLDPYIRQKKFIILTVKTYHRTPEFQIVQSESNHGLNQKKNTKKKNNRQFFFEDQDLEKQKGIKDNHDIDLDDDEAALDQDKIGHSNHQNSFFQETADLMSTVKPEKLFGEAKDKRRDEKAEKQNQKNKAKKGKKATNDSKKEPLFGKKKIAIKKNQAVEELKQVPSQDKEEEVKEKLKLETFIKCIKLQLRSEELYKDYNGYLKAEKSLIEMLHNVQCVIYDSEKDIFFD